MTAVRSVLLFCAAWLAWPAAAAPVQPAAAQSDNVAAIEAETAAYGRWLARVQEIETPAQTALAGLSNAWQAAQAGGGQPRVIAERFRPVIAEALAAIDAANGGLAALELPEFRSLDLPEDVRPARIVREMGELNRQIRTAIEAFNPLLDAMANEDLAAVRAAGERMLSSIGIVLESQVVLARAGLAATPSDDPSRGFGQIDLLFFRAGARVFAAFRPFEARTDAALAADLIALAGELDASADSGTRRIDEELDLYRQQLAEMERSRDRDGAAILRRAVAVFTAGRAYFPLARELAAMLRAEAGLVRGRPSTMQTTVRFFERLTPFRARIEEINRQAVGGMAAPQ